MSKKVLLMILDGYGISSETKHNAIALAKKPNLDRYWSECAHSELQASGRDVGLPNGVMGNSEVGHLNIGGGRVIKQELSKISDFAAEFGFETLPDVKRVLDEKTGTLHFIGLLSDGSVHSHEEHLFALLKAVKKTQTKRPVCIHVITDGRDTPPQSALTYVDRLTQVINDLGVGKIATVSGRFYTMDRDKRWDRLKIAYDGLTRREGKQYSSAKVAVQEAYAENENDEFIKPRQIEGGSLIQNGDSVLFFNFRADRAREISAALALDSFSEFPTPVKISPNEFVTFTAYDEKFPFPVLFRREEHLRILGELVAEHGEKQLRIAETEKYAHVTYFFNGGEEKVFDGEERVLVPSPKEVRTYDEKPEMAAYKLTEELIQKMNQNDYKLIVLNYANTDMVGHTGIEAAAIRSVEVVDDCVGKACKVAKEKGYDVLITADHGNAECMVDGITHAPQTAHTTNPVPLIWIPADENFSGGEKVKHKLSPGKLADIAPTILKLYGWPVPPEMSGHNLIQS